MDHHIFYDETTKLKMAGKMILNKIIGSRKRLVISLMLAVLFLDVCILATPRSTPAGRGASAAAAAAGDATATRPRQPTDPERDPADPRLDPSDPDRDPERDLGQDRAAAAQPAARQRRRPARWPPIDPEKELRRELDLEQEGAQEQEADQERKEEESADTGWSPDETQESDRDVFNKLNEVDVDADDRAALKSAAGPTAPVTLVRLEVEAGEEAVDVKLNGQSLMVPEINNRTRGLHVLVLEQNTYTVMARRRFDTVMKQVYREVVHFIDAVRPGRIIVLASKDDMSFSMHSDLRFKLTELGSQFIPNLGFRDQWAMVTVKGSDQTLGETFSPAPAQGEYGGPLFLRVDLVPGSLPATQPCPWPESEETSRRHDFCDNFEGYPGVCRCLQPHPILPGYTVLDEDIDSIFVAVMATHRPYYLYRSLRSLAFATGAQAENIIVYLENSLNPELEALVALFGFKVRYMATKPSATITAVIGNRIMDIFDDVFTTFMEAEYVLFIEEDLECSPDIFRYFGVTQSLLVDDPSVLSVSALNQQAFVNTSHAPSVAYRVDDLAPTGFLLHRGVFETDVKPAWPQYAGKTDWAKFMNKVVKKDREVVVPDVNRVYHIGLDSQFVNTVLYEHMSKNLSVNPDPTASLEDVTRLHKLNYEEDLLTTIQEGTVITEYDNLCNAGNMTILFKNQNKTEVVYFDMKDENDISTWFTLATCWGLWPFTTGHHGGLWRFWLENKKGFLFHMVFIGVPFSRYSSLKPSDLEPYRARVAAVSASGGPAAAGIPLLPAAGIPPLPAAGISPLPAAGIPPQPVAGIPPLPAAGIPPQPAAGIPPQPSAGIPPNPAVGRPPSSAGSSSLPPGGAVPAVAVPPPQPPSRAGPGATAAAPVSQASSRASSPQPPAPAAPAVPAVPARPPVRPTPTVSSRGQPSRVAGARRHQEV